MSTIDDKFLDVLNTHKRLENTIQLYMKTGYNMYGLMIEEYIDRIKIEYGIEMYNKFNEFYKGIKGN